MPIQKPAYRLITASFTVLLLIGALRGAPTVAIAESTARELPKTWKIFDPLDPMLPVLFTQTGDTARLDPAWQPTRIENVYYWEGNSEHKPIYHHQIAEKGADSFVIGKDTLSTTKISGLVAALADLQPTGQMIRANSFDFGAIYWAVDLTDAAGNHVVLLSASPTFPNVSRWNVYYNGQIYIQLTGAITTALDALFSGERAPDFPETKDKSRSFSSYSYPPQVWYQFDGLLPLATAFTAEVNAKDKTITGSVTDQTDNTSFSNLPLTDLLAIDLPIEAAPIRCTIEKEDRPSGFGLSWKYSCPLPALTGDRYDFPIRITYSSPFEAKVTTEGRLRGRIVPDGAERVLGDPFIRGLVADVPEMADLLTDHLFDYVDYNVRFTPGSPTVYNKVVAELHLLGETKVGETTIRYRLLTTMEIENNKVNVWSLDRKQLDQFLATVAADPLVKRTVAGKPDTILELQHSRQVDDSDSIDYDDNKGQNIISVYERFVSCPLGREISLPDRGEPLQLVGINPRDGYSFAPQFILYQNNLVTQHLELESPKIDTTGMRALLRPALTTAEGATFDLITQKAYSDESTVLFGIDKKTPASTRDALIELAKKLPGVLLDGKTHDLGLSLPDDSLDYYALEQAAITPASDGYLDIVGCRGARPTPTPRPPTNTPNPTPAVVVRATEVPNVERWSFYDPIDASKPALITKKDAGYALNAEWSIRRIEYISKWWGLGDAQFDYQQLEAAGDTYMTGSKPVTAARVSELIAAISNLRPVSGLASALDHTDDYPSIQIELIGKDGEHVILLTDSNTNPTVWNVLYNGRLYAQIDGRLDPAINALFGQSSGEPAVSFSPGGPGKDRFAYSVAGLPNQLLAGFVGLVPIADTFDYDIDATKGELTGVLQGRSQIGVSGMLIVGKITKLNSLELKPAGTSAIPCDVTKVPGENDVDVTWRFTCPIGLQVVGTRYEYPIAVTFGTDDDKTFTTEGSLRGNIRSKNTALRLPPIEIEQEIIPRSAFATELLTDVVPAFVRYSVIVDTANNRTTLITGEAIFGGQKTIGTQTIRYSIATPFTVSDGNLTYWALTRAALREMISKISALPLTRKIYANAPDVTLNLFYAEKGQSTDEIPLMNAQQVYYEQSVTDCSVSVEKRGTLPNGVPLRAFSFGSRVTFEGADFILLGDQAVVSQLALNPGRDTREGALPYLLPRQLAGISSDTLERIIYGGYFGNVSDITLYLGEKRTDESVAALRTLVNGLPGILDMQYDTIWEITGARLALNEEGQIEIAACAAK